MTLDEFRRHPAYDYYIITLVSDNNLNIKVMKRSFNRFRTTKNTEVIVFEKGGFVGIFGLSKKL